MKHISTDATGNSEGRRPNGQWSAGTSGNPNGRPRTRAEQPKSFKEELSDAMTMEIEVVDDKGKRRMVPAYRAALQELARSLPQMKLKEKLAAFELMQKLEVFAAPEPPSELRRMTSEERAQALGRIISEALAQKKEELASRLALDRSPSAFGAGSPPA